MCIPIRWRLFPLIVVVLLAVIGAACSKSPSSPYGEAAPPSGGSGRGPLDLGPFAPGQSLAHTFPVAGSFGYHCIPHRSMGMTGVVRVDSAGADSQVVTISGFSFTPASARVRPGGSVRWINQSSARDHTVTSD